MKWWVYFLLMGLLGSTAVASAPKIVPSPVSVQEQSGVLMVTPQCTITVNSPDTDINELVGYLRSRLSPATGYEFKSRVGDAGWFSSLWGGDETILLHLNVPANPEIKAEGYTLSVDADRAKIAANDRAGLFNGIQTLLQLLPPEIESRQKQSTDWVIPCVEIQDAPRFGWRGLMLDVSRHFMTKEEVMRGIDVMSHYKINRFHWHLADDQGWRLEIPELPNLIKVGAARVPRVGSFWNMPTPRKGEVASDIGYYTQDDIREVVAYAKARSVTIVPEIDVPGHSMALLASYPELACSSGEFFVNAGWKPIGQKTVCIGNEEVYKTLGIVFANVAALFPGEYIHFGGDEASKSHWMKCPKCRAVMVKHNIKDGKVLQTYFLNRIKKMIAAHGKKVIGWDEVMEGGAPEGTAVMCWQYPSFGIQAAKQGIPVVMSPRWNCYLDYTQGEEWVEPPTFRMNRLRDVYLFEPQPKEIPDHLMLGTQGNLWTEAVPTWRYAEYMYWPRGFAIAENAWSPLPKKSWENFISRTEWQMKRLDFQDVNYAKSMYNVIFKPMRDKDDKLIIGLDTEIPDLTIRYTLDNTNPDHHSPIYTNPISLPLSPSHIKVNTFRGNTAVGRQIDMPITELEKRVKPILSVLKNSNFL